MVSFQHTIQASAGLHIRVAGKIAGVAQRYPGTSITLQVRGEAAQAGQIFRVLALGAGQGDEITIAADGSEEQLALEELRLLTAEQL